MKVSVIVPVFNPGADIDDCIASLLGQSLPSTDYEVIFVDDGSTDATPARLDALAARRANVRVEHTPNSGWPGRPRNIGLDLARGDYVYFVDNDDWITPDALRRLHAMAELDRADIVVGKVVGHGRGVNRHLFARNRHGERFDDPVLLTLLTPHKLFRRAFVEQHGLRFPEGRRRLEDHPFVVGAYFAAQRISVLADHPCYHWVRRHDATASSRSWNAEGYFRNLREVLELVEARTEPGPWREALMAHWYREKMLRRVGGPRWLGNNAERRRELYESVRPLALERFGEDVHRQLHFNLRVRSKLLRAGHYDGLERLARLERRLEPVVRVKGIDGGGTHLVLHLASQLRDPRGGLRFERAGERTVWVPPAALEPLLAEPDRDLTGELRRSTVSVYLHSLEDASQYPLPARTRVRMEEATTPGRVRPRMLTTVPIAPTAAAAGGALPPGRWEIRAELSVAGFSRATTVQRKGAPLVVTTFPPGLIVVGEEPPPPPAFAVRAYRRLPDPAKKALKRTRATAAAGARG